MQFLRSIPSLKGKKLILVLGMHRSGTSVVTRALKVFGIELGHGHLARADNPKGFFEYPPLVLLDEAIFKALKLDWFSVKPCQSKALYELVRGPLGEKGLYLLESCLSQDQIFALKDPRLCRLLPFWRMLACLLKLELSCVLCLRAPELVAASLAKRDGLSLASSHALWTIYVREALVYSKGLPRILLSYDQLLEEPKLELARLARFLNLEINASEEELFWHDFLEKGLRHHLQRDQVYESYPSLALYEFLAPFCASEDFSSENPGLEQALFKAKEELEPFFKQS
ncbi:MAG: glycosyl transferase family 1 [Desulfovibrio sp.]|nr:glycosyl transferase family 1 [Desulfovibrio sp.]